VAVFSVRPPSVGATVDVANATWTNTIGAPALVAVWNGPDFDPAQRAFYYGPVLEIPTPCWTASDAKYFAITMTSLRVGGPAARPFAKNIRLPSGAREGSRRVTSLP
jgi:hypothetical protein